MAHAMVLLRLEHGNEARLLDVLEEEARALASGESVDHELVRMALEHFARYPQACHHPKEQLVMRHLRVRSPRLAARIEPLMSEHATFNEGIAELVAEIEGVTAESEQALGVALAHFCTRYRQHLDEEERTFFPAALESLDEADWDEIAYDLFDRVPPIFDQDLERRFEALREEIVRRAGRDRSERTEREELRWLEGIDDVDAFNARMRAGGYDLALVTLPDGSHAIERSGTTAARIPPCAPALAAWCAYFFFKGVEAELHPGTSGHRA